MNILAFTSFDATMENAGGKGANLVRLTRAGFEVPRGFIIPTSAYRAYVTANNLNAVISSALENLSAEDVGALESASAKIRAAFSAGKMPVEFVNAIQVGYASITTQSVDHGISVAVRSSATAEDLPELSFAGQQDTFLNVMGETQLLKAVTDCWSSLWTARAIGYRIRNGISHTDAALAVIVQEMVQSEVSGVLFTANPLTGLLRESVIDATFGLGEALVSGQVEPDHFVVDIISGKINEVRLGEKKTSTRGKADGGVESIREEGGKQTLSDNEIRQLVAAGQQVQEEYGTPQDIEWALAGGKLFILQSRAITSLFPVPQVSFDPLVVWFSFGAVQGLVGPLTPLGSDVLFCFIAGAARLFGSKARYDESSVFSPAAERIWVKISDMMRHPLGSRVFRGALGFIEPSVGEILRSLESDPRLGVGEGTFKFSTFRKLVRFAIPVMANLMHNMIHPSDARVHFDAAINQYLSAAQITPGRDRFERLANVTVFLQSHISGAFPYLLPKFISIFGPAMGAMNFLNHLTGNKNLVLEAMRSLPNNVTTEMDFALWRTAQSIRAEAVNEALFRDTDVPELVRRYSSGALPATAQSAVASFMEQYGMRGVAEFDFGCPRWREDPSPIFYTLKSYLHIDPAFAPDVVFASGEKAATEAAEKITRIARNQRGGHVKERIARAMIRRIRLLMGVRESPKFFAIRVMGIGRKALLEVGQEFVEAGTMLRADDLSFLKLRELESLAKDFNSEGEHWKKLIAERRAVYTREARRRQVPRVLISDGRAFYEGIGAATDTGEVITGSPVSPGVVDGIVHVVLDPRGAQLVPGEILVCPGTDPAWTPLFITAGGLVMEVGGMMTHGSVVAREYGLPAVVGVHQATLRLKDGQRIRVDGTNGKIIVIS